jgi:hypothetical protein
MTIKIISGHSIFNENAIVLSNKFGWKLESDFNPRKGDLYVVLGAHELAYQLLECQYRLNSTFGYIILNSEQIHSRFFRNKYYISLMKRNVVCDYNTITANYLKKTHDIKVLSYFYFEFIKFNNQANKEYDITFIGSKNPYREELLNEIQAEFKDLKFYIDLDWTHNSSDSLTAILHKSRVVLNIGYYDKERPLETHRINKALSCECDVVSTLSNDDDANEFYKDYCYMTDDIKATLHKYFNDQLDKKKSYEELIKQLSHKFNPHFGFIVTHVKKKLLSINNLDDSSTKNVEQPTATITTNSSDKETEKQS